MNPNGAPRAFFSLLRGAQLRGPRNQKTKAQGIEGTAPEGFRTVPASQARLLESKSFVNGSFAREGKLFHQPLAKPGVSAWFQKDL